VYAASLMAPALTRLGYVWLLRSTITAADWGFCPGCRGQLTIRRCDGHPIFFRKRLASDEARGWWPVLNSGIPLFGDVYASEVSARLDAQHAACAFTIIEAGHLLRVAVCIPQLINSASPLQ